VTWTPIEWQNNGKLRNWIRDRNNNFVDDLIEAQTGQVKIIVDLNHCIPNPATSELVQYLNTLGDVTYIGKYLSFIIVTGVDANRCVDIANRPEVAMVEFATPTLWQDDVLKASKVESSSEYAGNTLQDKFGWPGTLNGNGINIALLDSGVNQNYDSYFKFGYNAITDDEENPDAETPYEVDHASWMASWIWGNGGLAPQAGLIDIKIGNKNGSDPKVGNDPEWAIKGLEKVYEKRIDWNINIASLACSILGTASQLSAVEQLIDLLSGQGVTVVAGTGDNSANSPVQSPGSANQAIGISAADIHNTVERGDDTATFVKGPRKDTNLILESLKPELLVPTGGPYPVSISIATTITSGLVALILQKNPDLKNPDNKAITSIKDLLIRSADPKGTPDTSITYPESQVTWDEYWGFGELDAHKVFQHLTGKIEQGRTNLTFKGYDDSSHPNSPWYYSQAIQTLSERQGNNITGGVADKIFARILNAGTTQDAHNVRISFGFYPFTAGIPAFYHIGSVIVPVIQANSIKEVSLDWMPPILPAGSEHGCILVSIDYGLDSDFSNKSNFAQKNVQVKGTSSPAIFHFRVENPLPKEARIELKVSTKNPDWKIKLSNDSFQMETYQCARRVRAVVEPPIDARPGEEALFYITAYAIVRDQETMVEIGGVALKARFEGKRFKPKASYDQAVQMPKK
jgi:hypothetical protein